jgi:hypothetical protein
MISRFVRRLDRIGEVSAPLSLFAAGALALPLMRRWAAVQRLNHLLAAGDA